MKIINPYRFETGGSFAPTDISGLTAWFDASDATTLYTDAGKTTQVSSDGDRIKLWADKSSSGYDVTSPGTGPVYKTAAINSLDAALYAASFDERLLRANAPVNNSSNGSFTAFAVIKTPATVSGYHGAVIGDQIEGTKRVSQFLRLNGTTAEVIGFQLSSGSGPVTDTVGTVSASTVHLLRSSSTGTALEVFIDGTGNGSQAQTAQAYDAAAGLAIGFLTSYPWDGHICEVVIYNTALGASDITAVESYLNTKWGI